MCRYLKNVASWKLKDLKFLDDKRIEELYAIAKRNNDLFLNDSSKRAGEQLEIESSKKRKQEQTEQAVAKEQMQAHTELAVDSVGEAMDAQPLTVKHPIVDYKSGSFGETVYYDIKRHDGSSRRYVSFLHMVHDFDRQDMIALWKLLKQRFGNKTPEQANYDREVWNYLKVMFEPNHEDECWRRLTHNTVKEWKIFQRCGVHALTVNELVIYMLVEKDYPLKFHKDILHQMLRGKKILKLQLNYDDMAYELLRKMEEYLGPKDKK